MIKCKQCGRSISELNEYCTAICMSKRIDELEKRLVDKDQIILFKDETIQRILARKEGE